MPRENAAAAPDVTGANATGESNAQETSTAIPQSDATDILRHANVPEEVVKTLEGQGQEQKTEDSVEQPELPTQEKGEVGDQPEAEEKEPDSEEEEGAEAKAGLPDDDEAAVEEPEGKQPNWYQKRLAKWKRKQDRLQDEIDDLREQIAGKSKEEASGQRPAIKGNALGNVTNFAELQQMVDAQRAVRDWCMDNPEGVVIAAGTADEKVISPEDVRKTLIGATRIIEDAPRKAQELQTRAQWHELAQTEWPELFDKTSEIYQTSQTFLKQYPEIDQNPNRDFLLGLMVEGWKPFQQRMQERLAQGQNGRQNAQNDADGQNTPKDKTSLPEALKRKIPPIPRTQAPNPPRGSRGRSPNDDAAAAVQRLAREGGSQEAAMAAIAAIEKANAMSGDTKRTPAPV